MVAVAAIFVVAPPVPVVAVVPVVVVPSPPGIRHIVVVVGVEVVVAGFVQSSVAPAMTEAVRPPATRSRFALFISVPPLIEPAPRSLRALPARFRRIAARSASGRTTINTNRDAGAWSALLHAFSRCGA